MQTPDTVPSTASPLQKRRQMPFRLILLGGGLVVGLLFAEIALRLIGIGPGTAAAYQSDRYCGVRLVPNYTGWHTKEGRAWITINAHGFRERAIPIEKRPGTYRIAVLGDSFIEAMQVPMVHAFTSVLERELGNSCFSERSIEVLNFGCSEFGTAQELQMLRHYVWDYDPDFVLLAFLPANDVRNNSRKLEPVKGRPFFTLEGGELVLDDSFLDDPQRQPSGWGRLIQPLVTHSRIGFLVHQFFRQSPPSDVGQATTDDGFEPGLNHEIYQPPPNDDWADAWDVTEQIMVEMHREVVAHDAGFAVMLVNTGIQVRPEQDIRDAFAKQLGVDDLTYPETRIAQLGESAGFPVIHLTDDMGKIAVRDGTHFHGFPNTRPATGHWNATGHQQAAQLAAQQLCELLHPD